MNTEHAALKNWQVTQDDQNIVWACLDKPGGSANVLSSDVLAELGQLLAQWSASTPAGVVLYSGKEKGFIAGADITEFPAMGDEAQAYALTTQGHKLLAELDSLPCPTVAVINGFALGGGLELALACQWRIVHQGFKRSLGLPEVNLGLHPGLGGTVRLVRLIGVREAMSMMLTGKPVTPSKARSLGLVDRIVEANQWREIAAQLATQTAPARQPPVVDRLLSVSPLRPVLANILRKQVAARARRDHYPAPFALVDLWHRWGAKGEAAFDAEAKSFAGLVQSDTSKNLVRVYGLQEQLKHLGKTTGENAEHVHVVGAGVMGGDIAAWCALRGLSVTLQDRELKYIQPALERASKLFDKRLRGPGEADSARVRLVADVDGGGVAAADVVIEAIFEDREAKQNLYRQLEPKMKASALLATNTSSIPLQDLAPCLQSPERLVGLHFFNPVAKLPLVEIVSAPATSPAATIQATAFARQIGKLPLPCRSHPGFLVNRILGPYMAEAMDLMREGHAPEAIDQAAVDFGMPMGPVELADSVGLDVALHVAKILSPVIDRPLAPELEARVAAGSLGRKTGAGFYNYKNGKPERPRVPRDSVPKEVQERLILAYLNEAAQCLDEAVVTESDLVDAGAIFGTGFAPFRGGPINYALEQGVQNIVSRLKSLQERHGDAFKPAEAWSKLKAHNLN